MANRALTIAQIAEIAGVSAPTVSKVLNHRGGVATHTRANVEQVLRDNGYERRGRGRRGTGIIDLYISTVETQWGATLFHGANDEAQRLGLDVIVTSRAGDPQVEARWIDRLTQRGSDGVIAVVTDLSSQATAWFKREKIPVVLVDPVGPGNPSLPTISATNWAGGLSATEHLIGLGHTRIGIITGPDFEICSLDRLDGYSAALRRAGLPLDTELIRHGDSLVGGGRLHGGSLLDLPNPPTAIFSCSDEQAYGIYEAAHERGLKVPKDLSVVGFDDVNLCQWVTPHMTTVRQPLEEMGAVAVRQVANTQRSTSQDIGRYEVATSLVVRESTAKPRARR